MYFVPRCIAAAPVILEIVRPASIRNHADADAGWAGMATAGDSACAGNLDECPAADHADAAALARSVTFAPEAARPRWISRLKQTDSDG